MSTDTTHHAHTLGTFRGCDAYDREHGISYTAVTEGTSPNTKQRRGSRGRGPDQTRIFDIEHTATEETDTVTDPAEPVMQIDLNTLAYDIADLFDRLDYPIDATQDDVKAALPAFLAALTGDRGE